MTQTQLLNFTEGFPPAYSALETLMNINYKKHFHTFMDSVETFFAIVAAIVTVAYDLLSTWYHNGGKEMMLNAYTWVRETAVPGIQNAITVTYDAGVKVRQVYEVINARGFITL